MKKMTAFLLALWGSLCLTPDIGAKTVDPALLTSVDKKSLGSPDGKWELAVWGEKDEVPWVMLEARDPSPRYRVQVWPITRAVYVLWSPESQRFAFTDARFADRYFLFVDHIAGFLSSTVLDITPVIEAHFSEVTDKRYEILKKYIKPLRWVDPGHLLVGIDFVTFEASKASQQHQPVQDWLRGYILDVSVVKVSRELDDRQIEAEFGIKLQDEIW